MKKFFSLAFSCLVSLLVVSSAQAAPVVGDIWTAADISGISALLIPICVLIVGIALVGTGSSLAVRAVKRVRGAF